jgi:hypothetical protein
MVSARCQMSAPGDDLPERRRLRGHPIGTQAWPSSTSNPGTSAATATSVTQLMAQYDLTRHSATEAIKNSPAKA